MSPRRCDFYFFSHVDSVSLTYLVALYFFSRSHPPDSLVVPYNKFMATPLIRSVSVFWGLIASPHKFRQCLCFTMLYSGEPIGMLPRTVRHYRA